MKEGVINGGVAHGYVEAVNGPTICGDRTEAIRRLRLAQLNPGIGRADLERCHGTVLAPMELAAAYQVIGFMAPLVVVKRKADGITGSLEFQHHPRFYFNWQEHDERQQ